MDETIKFNRNKDRDSKSENIVNNSGCLIDYYKIEIRTTNEAAECMSSFREKKGKFIMFKYRLKKKSRNWW